MSSFLMTKSSPSFSYSSAMPPKAYHDCRCVPSDAHDANDRPAGGGRLHGDGGYWVGPVLLYTDHSSAECVAAHAPGDGHQRGEVPWTAWLSPGRGHCWH